jgi:hypothetical protein
MLAQRTVTIHQRWSAQEGCSVTRWWLVGGMFTLPNGKEEAPWGVGVVGPGYKLAEYLKRLNNQCFVKPHLCLLLPPTQSCEVSWLQWCMEQWQIWAHSCQVHWKKAGVGRVWKIKLCLRERKLVLLFFIQPGWGHNRSTWWFSIHHVCQLHTHLCWEGVPMRII